MLDSWTGRAEGFRRRIVPAGKENRAIGLVTGVVKGEKTATYNIFAYTQGGNTHGSLDGDEHHLTTDTRKRSLTSKGEHNGLKFEVELPCSRRGLPMICWMLWVDICIFNWFLVAGCRVRVVVHLGEV